MNKGIRKTLLNLPPWILSVVCVAAILWLTLFPKPFGDMEPQLFPGADKVVHALMFGGLALCILIDIWRKNSFNRLSLKALVGTAVISVGFGGLIEMVQYSMKLGRAGDIMDFAADTCGVITATLGWWLIEYYYDRESK